MRHKHKLIYPILGLALLAMVSWNIYSWGQANYIAGVNDATVFMKCRSHTPWQEDLAKMRGNNVTSCSELEVVLYPGYNELAKEAKP